MTVPPNGSLGEFTIAPLPDSSPAQYEAIANQNSTTVSNTYAANHVPFGSTTNAGYHGVVTLVPQATDPEATNAWQLFADTSNVYILPPSSTSGVKQQLNSSASLTFPSYWSQTQTITNAPPITVTYYLPLGWNSIVVTVQLAYTTAILAQNNIFVPYLDDSGNPFNITTPTSSFGIGILASNGGGGAYANAVGWGVYTFSGSTGATIGVYRNGITMTVGKSFTTSTAITVSASMTGVI